MSYPQITPRRPKLCRCLENFESNHGKLGKLESRSLPIHSNPNPSKHTLDLLGYTRTHSKSNISQIGLQKNPVHIAHQKIHSANRKLKVVVEKLLFLEIIRVFKNLANREFCRKTQTKTKPKPITLTRNRAQQMHAKTKNVRERGFSV